MSVWGEECPPLAVHERVRLSAVHDGDTLRLIDGRRVRLLTINAPELATDGKNEQPLARASRDAAKAFFADTDSVYLSFESRRTDRYGRILAHVTHPSGRTLESFLVSQGLALPYPVPPDLQLARCLQASADEARREGRGLWQSNYWQALPATRLHQADEAFRLVCGRIAKVSRQDGLWLELDGDLVLRIADHDFPYFADSAFDIEQAESWIGRHIEATGWLRNRSHNKTLMRRGFKPWTLQVRSPFVMAWMDDGQMCK